VKDATGSLTWSSKGPTCEPSSVSLSVNAGATIRPLSASVARWSLRHPRRVLVPCFSTSHSPGPQSFNPVNGVLHYLWRAVDQHGVVLDIFVQDRRNGSAAKRFFKRLLAGLNYKPRRLVTDGLKSYGVARRELLPKIRHRSSRYLNNRAENSHRPTRRRERQMQRFKSAGQAQRFLSAHSMIYGHFRPRRHLMMASAYRRARTKAFRIWRQETCAHAAS
jgi:putative transposase